MGAAPAAPFDKFSPFWAFPLVSSLSLSYWPWEQKFQNHIDASHSILLPSRACRMKSEFLNLASNLFIPLVLSIFFLMGNYLLIWHVVGSLLSHEQSN